MMRQRIEERPEGARSGLGAVGATAMFVGVLALGVACSGTSGNATVPNLDASSDEVADTGPRPRDTGSSETSTAVPEALPGAKSVACHVDESIPVVAEAPKAPPKGPPPKGAPKGDPNPPTVQGQGINISPKEIMWRIDEKRVGDIYSKVLENDFKPKYAKVQVGSPDSSMLDADLQQQKDVFRRSLLEFGSVPTGIDAGPLKGEYTYNNGETMMRITRKGKTRDFFFIQHKLWKIVDEMPLGADAEWGENFAAAVVKISGVYGVPGRICEPDYEHNRARREVDWRDANTQVRAIEWDDKSFALVFVDLGTVGQLASWRSGKGITVGGVDPSVRDVMHTPTPPPPKDDKDKKDDKKK
jgi:hypothetical protein